MPKRKKKLFVASSGKAKPLAKALALYLGGELPDLDITEWYDSVAFVLSEATLQGLITQADRCDFAVVLLTQDDFSGKEGLQLDAPRDNTIFELGLFMGTLGATRCFMVCSAEEKALPSDLKGLTYVKIEQAGVDLTKGDECRKCIKFAGAKIVQTISDNGCFDHPQLPLISRKDLAELETAKPDGNLLLEPDSIAVVVNSVEPVEQQDPQFSATVLKNMQAGARYEYFYGDFVSNISPTVNLVVKIATSGLMLPGGSLRQPPQIMPPDLDKLRDNLYLMRQNLSIHFRKRPPLQFCVHNALSEEAAICYLRYKDDFVRWADHREAREIAAELTDSCTTREQDCCIFHSTYDVRLDEDSVADAQMVAAIKARRGKILQLVKKRFPPELDKELDKICLGS